MNSNRQPSIKISGKLLMCALVVFAVSPIVAQHLAHTQKFGHGDFPLVRNRKTASIVVSTDDFKVAQIVAADLATDIEKVTGKKPAIRNTTDRSIDEAVIIGTLGKSPLIDSIAPNKLDASRIRGKWESYIIATIERPLPNIERALVIIGSDRRGTAFGVYEVSQMIGVSPWHWWADVTPERRTDLIISRRTIVSREPSVKYRGIFINDEDWGLQPWAAKTFERIFAVDTGVVLDKIVLSSAQLSESYFGPAETRFERLNR